RRRRRDRARLSNHLGGPRRGSSPSPLAGRQIRGNGKNDPVFAKGGRKSRPTLSEPGSDRSLQEGARTYQNQSGDSRATEAGIEAIHGTPRTGGDGYQGVCVAGGPQRL